MMTASTSPDRISFSLLSKVLNCLYFSRLVGKASLTAVSSARAIVFFVGGAAIQIALWKDPDRTIFDALMEHSYLWIIYSLLGMLIGEHCLRLLKRKR